MDSHSVPQNIYDALRRELEQELRRDLRREHQEREEQLQREHQEREEQLRCEHQKQLSQLASQLASQQRQLERSDGPQLKRRRDDESGYPSSDDPTSDDDSESSSNYESENPGDDESEYPSSDDPTSDDDSESSSDDESEYPSDDNADDDAEVEDDDEMAVIIDRSVENVNDDVNLNDDDLTDNVVLQDVIGFDDAAVTRIAEQSVTLYDNTKPFKDHLNVPLHDLVHAIADISRVRSNIILSAEQTNKTMTAVGIMTAAHMLERPVVMFVMDLKRSVEALCETKVEMMLRQFGIEARNPSGVAGFQELTCVPASMERFRTGKLVLVIQPLQSNIKLFYDEVVRKHRIHDLVFILDESDAMWSSVVDAADRWRESALTERERQMYRLLTGSRNDSPHAGLLGDRIRCMFSISATHLATLEWHSMLCLPYRAHIADLDMLRGRGYAVYDCLSVLKDKRGFKVYLEPSNQTASYDYNIHSPAVRRMVDVFAADAAAHPLKVGLLMMVAMSPRINADGMNAHNIARFLLHELRQRRQAAPSTSTAPRLADAVALVVCNDGPWLVELKSERNAVKLIKMQKEVHSRRTGRKITRRMAADEVLEYVDRKKGLETPVVVIGYACLKRCLSLRSPKRVITHIMVGPTKGMASANVQQMTMRCGGHTVDPRKENGFLDGVTALMTEADFGTVKNLYDFTSDALKASATGDVKDVDAWKSKTYAAHFAGILQTTRPHATGRIGKGIRESLSSARFQDAAQAAMEAAAMEEEMEDADAAEHSLEADIQLMQAALSQLVATKSKSSSIFTQLVLGLWACMKPGAVAPSKVKFGDLLDDLDIPGARGAWAQMVKTRKENNFKNGNDSLIEQAIQSKGWKVKEDAARMVAVAAARKQLA